MSDSVQPHRRQPTRLPRPWDSPGKNTGVGCHFLLQCVKVKSLSRVRHSATPWTAAFQVPLSMGFSRQEYWSGVPLPYPTATMEFLKQLKVELLYVHTKSFQSCSTLWDPMNCSPPGLSIHEIVQARILKWVTIFFSRGSSSPRDRTYISYIS